MVVKWEGRRATLTEKLFVDIATSFLTTHVAIDSNLSGGASGDGNVASRAMVDGLCVMAHIAPVAAQNICDAVFETGHTKKVFQEMNSVVGQAVNKQLPPLPYFDDRHSLDQATFDATETRLLTHFNVFADVRADNGPVHRAKRREHPRHAHKALLVLDARETINLKEQAGTLWRMVLTTWQACLCSNLGLASTLGLGAEVTEKK
jgi:hypothetical protein